MAGDFPDHFSAVAAAYARHRPDYPAELFDWLAAHTPRHARAWDCASGNGQAAQGLKPHFQHVVATDAAPALLATLPVATGIDRVACVAEACALADTSVDLACVAQAAHWFRHAEFHHEVARVLRPGGLLAIWGYGILRAEDPALDRLLADFHDTTLAPWWPEERNHIRSHYRDLPFPWPEIETPEFRIDREWDRDTLLGYLGTWSAIRRAQAAGQDPLAALEPALLALWPNADITARVHWPIFLRAGLRP
ncbi:class I SAM-dependent methyltransferase [Thioalkalivibrio thiocyanoxidans]|uniref:class I SAM-dependent methyltransferase n=1 Tax=Thioalkalivibrio thiocyanoxidans TaxID=152475 RepID=UPI00035D2AAB|nr:class I SAM-dependent methyltransferase [Thioalkalivibrio thiocyanoxidans]